MLLRQRLAKTRWQACATRLGADVSSGGTHLRATLGSVCGMTNVSHHSASVSNAHWGGWVWMGMRWGGVWLVQCEQKSRILTLTPKALSAREHARWRRLTRQRGVANTLKEA